MSQNEMILAALRRGPLTPMEALERFGCFRLAARVGELRERGYPIAVERCELPNGKKVARYFMGRAA